MIRIYAIVIIDEYSFVVEYANDKVGRIERRYTLIGIGTGYLLFQLTDDVCGIVALLHD